MQAQDGHLFLNLRCVIFSKSHEPLWESDKTCEPFPQGKVHSPKNSGSPVLREAHPQELG